MVGYFCMGKSGHLLLVKSSEVTLLIPPYHEVRKVCESEWIGIPLKYETYLTSIERKNLQILKEYKIGDLHYYCETYDLTHPYPSPFGVFEYEKEFVWNDFLAFEFEKKGLRKFCCVLLQGFIEEQAIEKNVKVTLLCKKSSYNPGTRYNARGLNDEKFSPGNEWEIEQLIWYLDKNLIRWSSVIWRRGTVPIHWKSKMVYGGVTPQDANVVIDEKPYRNISKYYQRLLKRYSENNSIEQITCVNLLRYKNTQEHLLTEHYEESLQYLKKQSSIKVEMIHFDWLAEHKNEEEEGDAVRKLWDFTEETIKKYGINSGYITFNKVEEGNLEDRRVIDIQICERQKGIFRVNCADSLDRTNICTFYCSLQWISEQCRRVGLNYCRTMSDNRDWSNFEKTLSEVEECYDERLLEGLAILFLALGDTAATLFTNSKAMHANSLRKYIRSQNDQKAESNIKIIVERRIENIVFDPLRQKQLEMFVGMNWKSFFNDYVSKNFLGNVKLISTFPAFVTKNIPLLFNYNYIRKESIKRLGKLDYENFLLEEHANENVDGTPIWYCKAENDFVEIDLYFPYYCRLVEMCITIRHGISKESAPYKMSVFVGTHLDDSILVFEDLLIPRTEDKTKLYYTFPSFISGMKERREGDDLYDFQGVAANSSSKIRVMKMYFHRKYSEFPLSIGSIQIFGCQYNERIPKQLMFDVQKRIKKLKKISLNFKKKALNSKSKRRALSGLADHKVLNDIRKDFEKIDTKKKDENEEEEEVEGEESEENEKEVDKLLKIPEKEVVKDDENLEKSVLNKRIRVMTKDSKEPHKRTYSLINIKRKKEKSRIDSYVESILNEDKIVNDSTLYGYNRTTRSRTTSGNRNDTIQNTHPALIIPDISNDTIYTPFSKLLIEKTKKYEEYVKSYLNHGKLNFRNTLKLEYARVKMKISSNLRNKVLLRGGYKLADFNPNKYIFYHDEKVEKAKRKELKSNNCKHCKKRLYFGGYQCKYCRYTFCKGCMCDNKYPIIEFKWDKEKHPVCDKCGNEIERQMEIIPKLQVIKEFKTSSDVYERLFRSSKPLSKIKGQKECVVSEFPFGGILNSVETLEKKSSPIETVLFPLGIYDNHFWKAPKKCRKVVIPIVLPYFSRISRMSLITDKIGFKKGHDFPEISVSIYERYGVKLLTWKWENNESNIPPQTEIKCTTVPTEIKDYRVRIVEFTLSLTKEQKGFLHLGRILVYGKRDFESFMSKREGSEIDILDFEEKKNYVKLSKKVPFQSRNQIKTTEIFYKESNVLDLILERDIPVSGFRIEIRHHPSEGVFSQVRRIRIYILRTNKSQELTKQELIGVFQIPKVKHGASLIYDFLKNYLSVYAVRFEFISTYRSRETLSYGKIYLFNSKTC